MSELPNWETLDEILADGDIESLGKAYLWNQDQIKLMRQELAIAKRERERIERENTILRGMTAKNMPCRYCGVDEIAKCPQGFPGCGLADDILCAQDEQMRYMLAELAELRREVERLRVIEKPDKIVLRAAMNWFCEHPNCDPFDAQYETKSSRNQKIIELYRKLDQFDRLKDALYGEFPETPSIWSINYVRDIVKIIRENKEVDRILSKDDPQAHYEALHILDHMVDQVLAVLPKQPTTPHEVNHEPERN